MSGCFFQHFNRVYGKIWVSFCLNTWKYFFLGVILNHPPTSTQFHPPPPSLTQLHPPLLSSFPSPPSSIHPAYFNLHPALCNTLNNIWTKKFWPQNPFLGNFGLKNSKLLVLSKNWYPWYLKDADSYSNISFLNFKL